MPTRRRRNLTILLFTLGLCANASPAGAQQPFSPAAAAVAATGLGVETLPVEIGRATRGPTTYYVFSTAPAGSTEKGQKLQLLLRTAGPGGSETSFVVVNTGKTRTLAQLGQTLAGALRRFAAGVAGGQEMAKIGDLRFGGELRLLTESPDSLLFQYIPPTARPVRLNRTDAAAFAAILGG